jgi:DNA primase
VAVSSAVYQVVRKHSIVDYLEKKGHQPCRTMSDGKLFYWCPLPDHQERNAPSFVVYTTGEFENFYCFGCGYKYTIIDLYAKMEGVSKKEAFTKLAEGLGIEPQDDISFQIEQINKQSEKTGGPSNLKELANVLLEISLMLRDYLTKTNGNLIETSIIDRFYAALDQTILDYEFDNIRDVARMLPEFLLRRRKRLAKNSDNVLPEVLQ